MSCQLLIIVVNDTVRLNIQSQLACKLVTRLVLLPELQTHRVHRDVRPEDGAGGGEDCLVWAWYSHPLQPHGRPAQQHSQESFSWPLLSPLLSLPVSWPLLSPLPSLPVCPAAAPGAGGRGGVLCPPSAQGRQAAARPSQTGKIWSAVSAVVQYIDCSLQFSVGQYTVQITVKYRYIHHIKFPYRIQF